MGKRLLGISGSPRKNGNCEIFIKEIFRRLGNGWELQVARLPDLEIRPCRACYQCLFDEMRCPQDDDFLPLLDALANADAYVVAAPTYLLSANGSLKKFMDRGLQFYAFVDKLWGKPGIGVAIAGIVGMEGSTKLNVESFIKLSMGDLRGTAVVYGALPGETLLSKENRNTAAQLAQAILNRDRAIRSTGPHCPICGGDTFRFLPGGGARCMLCSGSGAYESGSEGLLFRMEPGNHPLFLSREHVLRHAEWLRGMKDEFLQRRRELKEAVKDYLGAGELFRGK